ncbi:polysaccharide deacetylase family protein [Pseudochelatococcus sp. B33]
MIDTLLITVNVHGLGPEAATGGGNVEALYGRLGHGRYAYRIGLARLLDALRDLDVKATFFWPSSEALRVPNLFQRCLDDNHEIAGHGRAFEDHAVMDEAREADVLGEAHDVLTRLSGRAPRGYRAPNGILSPNTLRLLAGLGYLYDSSALDDDAPYALEADGAPGMVELPWSEGLSDSTHFSRRLPHARAELFLTEELDALMPVAGYACLTLHPRADIGIARSSRLPILSRLVRRAHDAGLVARRCEDEAQDRLVQMDRR